MLAIPSFKSTFIPSLLPFLHVFPAFQIQNWFLTTLHLVATIVHRKMEGPSLIPSPSSSPDSCTSTNRLLSSSSSSSSSIFPTFPPLLSSRFRWVPITPLRPLQGLDQVRWEGPHLWIPHMQMRGNLRKDVD